MKKEAQWKTQMRTSIEELTNRNLLEEMLDIAGGDDYDGMFTTKGEFKYNTLKLTLESRLKDWLQDKSHPNVLQDIKDFHTAFEAKISDTPQIPDEKTIELRKKLILEEHNELMRGLKCNHITTIADGIVDCIVVLLGTAIAYGIPFDECWNEVHKTNMAKLGPNGKPIKREDGKVLKPEGWQPPKIKEILENSKC